MGDQRRGPSITAQSQPVLYEAIASKAEALGAHLRALGGVEEHVHLVASIPPTIAVAQFVAQVKGASSHAANHDLDLPRLFRWQVEYGALSLSHPDHPRVIRYVWRQREHHGRRSLEPTLERCEKSRG